MHTTTIRIPSDTRDQLNALARRRGTSAGEVVAELVRRADDQALLADAAAGWRALAADPELLAAYRAETAALERFDTPAPEY
jgi:predicted transcriptional regulator